VGPTVLDERGAFAVENPEVAEVMEIASGDHLDHGEVIGTDYEKAIQLRMALRTDIKRGSPHYACSLCGVPVYLVSRAEERRFFFRHTLEDGRCLARTRGELSQEEIDARRYNGVKESARHLQMKEWVAQCLAADPRFTDVATEKRWSGTLTAEWRKPDVRAIYRGIPVVFEIQLSTTYVNVIAERREFYLQEGGLLIWIFAHFDGGARRLTQDDVFFNNNRNAFVVTQATRDASVQQGRFMLDCIWAEPTLMGNADLQRRVVGFDDLTLERESQRAYYFDFDGARDALQEQARERERQRLAEVREKFETWWLDYETSDTPDYRGWAELRRALAAEGVELPQYPNHVPRTLLNALYSAKHGRVIGWRFKTFIEVAHRVEPAHRRYLHYFRRALAAYDRADQLRAEDKSGKWALKVKHYKAQMQINDPAYTPDTSDMKLVVLLFPEIFV